MDLRSMATGLTKLERNTGSNWRVTRILKRERQA
jgi:hypothetical protein